MLLNVGHPRFHAFRFLPVRRMPSIHPTSNVPRPPPSTTGSTHPRQTVISLEPPPGSVSHLPTFYAWNTPVDFRAPLGIEIRRPSVPLAMVHVEHIDLSPGLPAPAASPRG